MNKLLALILTLATLLVLAACGETPITPTEAEATEATTISASEECGINGHNYIEEVIPPTCTSYGYTLHTCTRCGASYENNIVKASGHTVEVLTKVGATCTSEGKTRGLRCSVCGEILTPQEVIPKTDHRVQFIKTVLPTTSSEGKTYGTVCTVCGEILSGCEPISKLTESAQSTAKELPLDFNEFKDNVNKERNTKIKNYTAPYLPPLVPSDASSVLTDEECKALINARNGKDKLTKEEAIYDVDLLFRALKTNYAFYYYFGEEKYINAHNEILDNIEEFFSQNKTIYSFQLENIICQSTDKVIKDLHYYHHTTDYVQYYYFYAQGLFLHKDTYGYYLKNGEDKWYAVEIEGGKLADYIKVTISPEGELVYTLGYKYLLVDESPKPAYIVLKNGDTKVNYDINWTLSETKKEVSEKRNDYFSTSVEDGYNVIRISKFYDDNSDVELNKYILTGKAVSGQSNFILDLRANGGGNGYYNNEWLKNFFDDSTESYLRYQTPNATSKIWSNLRYYNALANGEEVPSYYDKNKKYCFTNWEYVEWFKDNKRLNPNENTVFWITDNQSGSTGDGVISWAQTFENMIVIGTHTMGCTGSHENMEIYLPNSGIGFSISMGAQFYGVGEILDVHGTGFDPDIWVPSEYALELTIKLCEYYGLEPSEKKVETYGTAPARVSLDGYAGY